MITKQITIINCYIYFSLFISFLEFLNYLSIRAASSIRLRKGAAICVLWRHHSGQAWPDVTFLSLLPGRRAPLTTDDALGYVTIGTNVTQHPPEKRWVSHSSVIASLQFSLDRYQRFDHLLCAMLLPPFLQVPQSQLLIHQPKGIIISCGEQQMKLQSTPRLVE